MDKLDGCQVHTDGAEAKEGILKKTNETIYHSTLADLQRVRGGQLIRQFAQAAQRESFEWISGPSHNVKSKPVPGVTERLAGS